MLMSATGFAQTLDVNGFKQLLTARKATLEKVSAGMSKKIVTSSKIEVDQGICNYRTTSIQSIVKVEAEKIIVHTKDLFQPQNSAACHAAGYKTFEESMLFTEKKPSLADDLSDLDISAPSISAISRAGEIVTLSLAINETMDDGSVYSDNVTIKYDLTKPSFRNTISSQGNDYQTIGQDMPDIDLNTLDLKDILFCENNDGDNSECVQGDFSDLLF